MVINKIDKIKEKDGDYIVIQDLGSEGLNISSQHKTLEEAIKGLSETYNSQYAIVKLVKLSVEEI